MSSLNQGKLNNGSLIVILLGVMVAWTGIEHYCMGRFDPAPSADKAEEFVVCSQYSLLLFIVPSYPFLYVIALFWNRKQDYKI